MDLFRTRQYRQGIVTAGICVVALCMLAGSLPAFGDAEAFFETQIRPILVDSCYTCHSAQSDPVKGELLLDSLDGMTQGGASGLPAVVPGDVEASRLVEAIRYHNADLQMPPKEALPASVVAAFEAWIADGAIAPTS